MIRQTIHKALVVFLTITLLLPIGMSFIHALEDHSYENCGDLLQFHTHKKETNCAIYHHFPGNQIIENNTFYFKLIQKINTRKVFSFSSIFITTSKSPKQLRAPPVLFF